MKCPHCLHGIHANFHQTLLIEDDTFLWYGTHMICPECGRPIITLHTKRHSSHANTTDFLVYPKTISRSPLSQDVPSKYAEDYREACLVLADSPKASAALSRRCLQHLLWDEAKVKGKNLDQEIQTVIDSKILPPALADSLDAVRVIGNFAAHPTKSQQSGEIVDVEPGEAEWSLDVLEGLFEHFFVQPALLKHKRAELDKKLAAAGKPALKKA